MGNLKSTIKTVLAEYLGVEPEDFSDEDSLFIDLHMKPTDLTDFLQILENKGITTSNIDLSEIDTVGEFMEAAGAEDNLD